MSNKRVPMPATIYMQALWEQGMDTSQIAKYFCIPESYVANCLARKRDSQHDKAHHTLSPKCQPVVAR